MPGFFDLLKSGWKKRHPPRDKLDLSNPNFLDVVVDRRRYFLIAVALATGILAIFVPGMQADPTLESGVDKTSEAYLQQQRFVKDFGNEEFILVAIRSPRVSDEPAMLQAVQEITLRLEHLDKLVEVISLANLKIFQKRGNVFGNYPILRSRDGELTFPDASQFDAIKNALPVMDLLISGDRKTFGVLLRMEERWKHDVEAAKLLREEIAGIVTPLLPPGAQFRVVGAPFIRQAIVRYNIQTGIIFGTLCILIGTVVSVYVFRSAKVAAVTNLILGICVLWILGLMAICNVPVNSTTVLAFGFIPITTIEIVIHIVVRYHLYYSPDDQDKNNALKKAVRWLARPCFICIATTAVGFGTLMVSSIPMVRQLGFIMSVGVLISYSLAMVLTPAFFAEMRAPQGTHGVGSVRGWLDKAVGRIESAIFNHHRLFVVIGFAVTALLLSGAPFIKSDMQLLRLLSEDTPEVKDIHFVEQNLFPVASVELLVKAKPQDFSNPALWSQVAEVEKSLRNLPTVVGTDSLLPLLVYLNGIISDEPVSENDLFANQSQVSQVLNLISMSADGKRQIRRFLDADRGICRITVRLKDAASQPIVDLVNRINEVANSALNGEAKAIVTGDLAVIAQQTSALISDQVHSMFLAAALIAVLMIFQMNSLWLGLISIIPNIPPVAAAFGIMGWFGITLDAVTIFAATVSLGLAVDNTIHFLTQLKREMAVNRGQTVEECISSAYRLTARQISAWSTITLLGLLALTVSPFRPVVYFGILCSAALFLGLYGDLVFIQSLLLSSKFLRRVMSRLVDRETGSQSDSP